MSERLVSGVSAKIALYKYSFFSFPFLSSLSTHQRLSKTVPDFTVENAEIVRGCIVVRLYFLKFRERLLNLLLRPGFARIFRRARPTEIRLLAGLDINEGKRD